MSGSLSGALLVLVPLHVSALVPVDSSMSSFGVAIKEGACKNGVEQVVFEHNVSKGTHGVITQMSHAGTGGDPRMRIYVDSEVGGPTAAVDYSLSIAHGLAPEDEAAYPWQSERFGHTHNMGWFNMWQVPFERRVRVTITCDVDTPFWLRVGGVENYPISVGQLQLPPSAKLQVAQFKGSVDMLDLVELASVKGSAGLLAQQNMFVQSSEGYQEGCMSALVDGRRLMVSSGLEDYFMGSYFHSMPDMALGIAGFRLSNSSSCTAGANSLAAYRIHDHDPVLFSDSFSWRWQPSGQPMATSQCNYGWPERGPSEAGVQVPGLAPAKVDITSYAWVYTYSLPDAGDEKQREMTV